MQVKVCLSSSTLAMRGVLIFFGAITYIQFGSSSCHSGPDSEPKARGKGEESYVLLATEIAMRILL